MTVTRSDIPRLGASLGVLGTILEHRGQEAFDKFDSWQFGPRKAPAAAGEDVCSCGHTLESHDGACLYAWVELGEVEQHYCWCNGFTAAPHGVPNEDRAAEQKQRARAADHFREHRADLQLLDEVVQRITRRMDVACPPNPEEMKNRRTGNLDPITPAEAAVDGLCASCWRNDQYKTPIDVNEKTGLRYYRDYCRWCGGVKGTYGVEPPMDMLKLHHDDRRINPAEMEAAVARLIEQAKPKSKGKKKKQKKGWVAA